LTYTIIESRDILFDPNAIPRGSKVKALTTIGQSDGGLTLIVIVKILY
jgi:hypothetical protein